MTIPERLAEEQRKREEERREAEEACRLKRPREQEMRLKLQEEFARIRGDKPVEKRIEKVEKEEKREKAGLVVANYEAPVDGMQIVGMLPLQVYIMSSSLGLYDDVRWVFELSLVETEEKKRRENARQEAEKLKKQKGGQEDDATSEPVELPGRPTDGVGSPSSTLTNESPFSSGTDVGLRVPCPPSTWPSCCPIGQRRRSARNTM